MKRLMKIWLILASITAQPELLNFYEGIIFLFGKTFRFLFFFVFLFVILSASKTMAGYDRNQVIFFFLVFNLVDIISQFLFRGVYNFRQLVISGDFDIHLIKPVPSFFWPIFGWTDIFDFFTLVPLWAYFVWFTVTNSLFASLGSVLVFILLLANSIFLSFSIHLFVSAVCVLTTEIDHLIMVYRDFEGMGRFPTDIYQKGIQYFLTFTVPVVILVTVPAKAFLGLLSIQWVFLALGLSGAFFIGSFLFWNYAISKYSSASS